MTARTRMLSARFSLVLFSLGLFLLLLSADCQELRAEDNQDAQVQPSMVRVSVTKKKGKMSASGFVLAAEGVVVTNFRLVSGAHRGKVTFGNRSAVEVLGTLLLDPERDIAILKVKKSNLTPLPLAKQSPGKGAAVKAFGITKRLELESFGGMVAGVRKGKILKDYADNIPGQWIQTKYAMKSVTNGGPLVNVAGEVVAMNTSMIRKMAKEGKGDGSNFSISAGDLHDALELAKKNPIVPLADGAAKTTKQQKEPEAPRLADDEVPPSKIPKASYVSFVNEGKELLPKKIDALKDLLSLAQADLKFLRTAPIRPDKTEGKDYVIGKIRGRQVIVFQTRSARDSYIEDQTIYVEKLKTSIKNLSLHHKGLYLLLRKAGPRLELSSVGTIGHLSSVRIKQIISNNEFHATVNKMTVAFRGVNTKPLVNGQKLNPGVVYISGTAIYSTGRRGKSKIFILRSLPGKNLADHLRIQVPKDDGDNWVDSKGKSLQQIEDIVSDDIETVAEPTSDDKKQDEGEFRTWVDAQGKELMEAKATEFSKRKVTLEKRDGTSVTMPLDKLSLKDQSHILRRIRREKKSSKR